jgi:signal transduction histidine kinase
MEEAEIAARMRILRNVDIFSELRKPLLKELVQKVELIEVKPDENIIKKGEHGHALYVIIEGHVKVHDGQHEFAKLSQGECFGEYALIDPEVRNASITGVTEAKLFKLKRADFYELVDENPGFVNAVLVVLIRRLRKVDEVQKSLAESYLQIAAQNEKIELQNLELSNLNEEKDHLMSIIAHDIRNPLSSSISIAESLQAEIEKDHPEFTEYTQALTRSLWRINDLAGKILEVKSEEHKRTKPRLECINLGNLLQNIEQEFRQRARRKDITIKFDSNNQEVYASLDAIQASQIFENLVSNAIKFSPPGRTVFMKVEDRAGKAIVEIRDQGPGFTERDKEKVFTRFQRLSAIPTAGENSLGLGLSIVKKYVDQLHGEIELLSENGRGATFVVRFESILPE